MQKLIDIPGVKTVMLLPSALSCAVIFTPAEITRILAFKLELKHVLILSRALLVLVVLLAAKRQL